LVEVGDKWANLKGTVGAVAIDASGNVAAATSTGGTVGKIPGRVGDTPGVSYLRHVRFGMSFSIKYIVQQKHCLKSLYCHWLPVMQVGHGIYADINSGGVSCTGTGETFIRAVIARRIGQNLESSSSMSTNEAVEEALNYMNSRVGGDGGAIALSPTSMEIGIDWNSKQGSGIKQMSPITVYIVASLQYLRFGGTFKFR
jgi:beta-aspartyl-peptidase (threonine type)